MWKTYEQYCDEMRNLHAVPLSKEIWKREYAPKDDEVIIEPLRIRPKNQRPISATMQNHQKG